MHKQSKILVTGASGLIGSALVRLLKAEGYENVLTPPSSTLDLMLQGATIDYFLDNKPEFVFHLAAEVGGIASNMQSPADFSRNNTLMIASVFWGACLCGVKKLLFPGSACAYPALNRPIKESDFMQGPPEPTNIAYAAAKINGIIMAQSYAKQYGMKVVLPMVANTYGPSDRSSHVIPMMIEKFRKPNPVFWGTGRPIREFIHADDVASAFLFLMLHYDSDEIINVGTQAETSIYSLAVGISLMTGQHPKFVFDTSKPDGVMRKVLDSSKIRVMGWDSKITLEDGLRDCI